MAKALPELTRKQIQKAWRSTTQTKREIAAQFRVSEATVKRLTHGIDKDAVAASQSAVVSAALSYGSAVTIDGLSLNEYVGQTIVALAAELPNAPAKSKEGVAGALLRYLEFHERLHPQRIEGIVDQLLAHPDFNIEKAGELIRRRLAG
ncbi:MAG: hypothetical protein RLZZ597_3482 [Cyanobacteriota bacterium]|jgi:hypothetical protein